MATVDKDKKSVKRSSPRDIFLHLLGMVTLYASAISFLTLVFQYINIWVPDPSAFDFPDRYQQIIRFALAMLIVLFPVYIGTSWLLNKVYRKQPEKRQLRIRKWLIYFTLFVAALIIMGFLVGVINAFLGGELTLRFGLKFLAVLFVAGSVFGYYLWDIRRDSKE